MRADDGRVEHLHEMRSLAQGGERFEESFEHAAAAQAPEALPESRWLARSAVSDLVVPIDTPMRTPHVWIAAMRGFTTPVLGGS